MPRNDRVFFSALFGTVAAIVISILGIGAGLSMTDLHATAQLASETVTAFATIVLAWFTVVLARQTKRLADVGEQPSIVVTIEPNRHSMIYLDMHVQNTGTATAYDIEIGFDPNIRISGQTSRRVPMERISILKPSQAISSSLASWAELEPKAFTVRTSWKRRPDSVDREYLSYSIDLNHLEGISRLGSDPDIDMAQAAKTIADSIQSISRGNSTLSVNTFSAEDRATARAEMEQMIEARRAANRPAPIGGSSPNQENQE